MSCKILIVDDEQCVLEMTQYLFKTKNYNVVTALNGDEALEAVYNYYRAIPLWQRDRVAKVPMPTLFIWPPGSGNISRAAAEACEGQVTGPYCFEVVEDVHQPILQAAPEILIHFHKNSHLARLMFQKYQLTKNAKDYISGLMV